MAGALVVYLFTPYAPLVLTPAATVPTNVLVGREKTHDQAVYGAFTTHFVAPPNPLISQGTNVSLLRIRARKRRRALSRPINRG